MYPKNKQTIFDLTAPSSTSTAAPTQVTRINQNSSGPTAPKPLHLDSLTEILRSHRPKITIPPNFKPVTELDSEITKLGYHFDDTGYINDQPSFEIPYGPPRTPKMISKLDLNRVRNNFDKIYGIESISSKFGARNATGFKLRSIMDRIINFKDNMKFRNHRYSGEDRLYEARNEYLPSQSKFIPNVYNQQDISEEKDYGFLNHYLFPTPVPNIQGILGNKHVIHQINQLEVNRRNLLPSSSNIHLSFSPAPEENNKYDSHKDERKKELHISFTPDAQSIKPSTEYNNDVGYEDGGRKEFSPQNINPLEGHDSKIVFKDQNGAFDLRDRFLRKHEPQLQTEAIQKKFDGAKDDDLKLTRTDKLDIYYYQ